MSTEPQAMGQNRALRMLVVTQGCPWPATTGGQLRLHHLIGAMVDRHRVTLVTPGPGDALPATQPAWTARCEQVVVVPDIPGREAASRAVYGLWAPASRRLRTLLGRRFPASVLEHWDDRVVEILRALRAGDGEFDLVWAERPAAAEMARAAGFRQIVVDLPDLDTVILSRALAHAGRYLSKPLHYAELAKLTRYERSLPARFGTVLVCKDEDQRFFPDGGRQVSVVPNGVEPLAALDPRREQPGELLFVGTLFWEANVQAVRWFHQLVLPAIRTAVPGARFAIVGRQPVPTVLALADGVSCTVHGDVPDIRPFYESAAVVVAPIWLGSGTKLKVLEALALGRALVATSIAVEGIDLRPGIDFALADTPEAFADTCAHLLADADARRQLAEQGRARVLERYTWEAIGTEANRVIEAAIPETADQG